MKTSIQSLLSQRERVAETKTGGKDLYLCPPIKNTMKNDFKRLLPQVIYQIYRYYPQ